MKIKASFKCGICISFVVFGYFIFSAQNIHAACLVDGDCADADPCTYDACNVSSGVCSNHKSCGGLVPCGRLVDNLDTPGWNETDTCGICHVIPLVHGLIAYLVAITGIISILMIALAMIASNTAIADSGQITSIKLNLSKVIQGFIIVFVAWVIVNLVMTIFGFIDPIGDGSWKKFDCNF